MFELFVNLFLPTVYLPWCVLNNFLLPSKLILSCAKIQLLLICSNFPKFYSSSIVGGTLSIALGVAMGNKIKKSKDKVWVFIGDMTYETGVFHECHKYAIQNKLKINFVVEDNNMSTNTPTDIVWKNKTKKLQNVQKYNYKRKFPHHGTGSWILF